MHNFNEDFLGYMEEPEYTCPMLDKALDCADKATDSADKAADEEDILKYADDCEQCEDIRKALVDAAAYADEAKDYAESVRDGVEEARTNAENLRAWGQDWKDLSERLFKALFGEEIPEDWENRLDEAPIGGALKRSSLDELI